MTLGDILVLRKGNSIEIQDAETYRISGIQNCGKGVVVRREVKGSELTMRQYQVIEPNQLMWCKVDTKNGAFGVTHPEHAGTLASPNTALADINLEKADPKFLETLFRVPSFADYITKLSSGTTNRKYLTPPELLRLVSLPDWDTKQQRAFVHKLRQIEDYGLAKEITHQETLLAKLQQAILQEAIQGKLTADWRAAHPQAEPARQLLHRIQAEKARLIAAKKLRPEKPLPKITPAEIPFEIPKGWEWCRLGDVSTYLNGYAFQSQWFAPDGIRLVRNANVSHGFLDWSDSAYIPAKRLSEFDDFQLREGDIVLSLDRPIISTGLKAARVGPADLPALLLQRVLRIEPVLISSEFMFKWLFSALFLGSINPGRSIGVPHVSHKEVMSAPFPLPPLAEQAAIVARVEALITTCRLLEAEIEHARTHSAHLLQAVLKEAFAPAA